MASYRNENIKDRVILLDGADLEDCQVENCELLYEGGALPRMVRCTFDNSSFRFGGSAERTVFFLVNLIANGQGGEVVVEQIFKDIRRMAASVKKESTRGEP